MGTAAAASRSADNQKKWHKQERDNHGENRERQTGAQEYATQHKAKGKPSHHAKETRSEASALTQ